MGRMPIEDCLMDKLRIDWLPLEERLKEDEIKRRRKRT